MRRLLAKIIKPHGRASFLYNVSELFQKPNILDVGCGNDAIIPVKKAVPHFRYTGIDVQIYNMNIADAIDEYILVEPSAFADKIGEMANRFDVVISAHNLEHCLEREKTFRNMLRTLKKGGMLYLSCPSEKSVSFPSRRGTLNYYDDETHIGAPPDFSILKKMADEEKCVILFEAEGYKPPLAWLIGLLFEPFSALMKRIHSYTWNFYGFESIIWVKKP
jgi:SAM-dependent methyltransferase